MKQETTNQPLPLYKVLNQKRTQGVMQWKQTNGNNRYEHTVYHDQWKNPFCQFGIEDNGEVAPEEIKANAQYTALAVNELANLAEALEEIKLAIGQLPARGKDGRTIIESLCLNKAKEALSRIS